MHAENHICICAHLYIYIHIYIHIVAARAPCVHICMYMYVYVDFDTKYVLYICRFPTDIVKIPFFDYYTAIHHNSNNNNNNMKNSKNTHIEIQLNTYIQNMMTCERIISTNIYNVVVAHALQIPALYVHVHKSADDNINNIYDDIDYVTVLDYYRYIYYVHV